MSDWDAIRDIEKRLQSIEEKLDHLSEIIEGNQLPYILKVKDVMQLLGVSRNTVYRLCNIPGFPARKYRHIILVSRDGLLKWIEAGQNSERDENG